MKRRTFLAGLTATATGVRFARAQANVPVIGFLHPGTPESGSLIPGALREGLRDAGYVVNETIKVEERWGRGKPEVIPQLVQELLQLRVALLIPTARVSIEAARAATKEVP